MLSLMDTIVSLVVKVLWKLISLICFRVYLEVNVHKNPTCFSRWSVSYTKSNKMWKVGCFYGTGEELVKKAYDDSENSGKHYELYVNLVREMEKMENEID